MLDQVCNAINILKQFGTCLILLLSSSLSLFLYWPILIYLFLPWPTLSYQIPPFQLAQTQGEAHGYEVKGGLQISLWNGNNIHKCSSHVHNSGPDSVRDKRMERSGPKPLQGALCSSQLEYSPLLSHTWSSQQPPEPPSARLCLVLCWIKEGLKMTEMCLAQSWRGASTAATKGQWQCWCCEPQKAVRASPAVTCGTDPIQLSAFGCASLSSHPSLFCLSPARNHGTFQEMLRA